MTIISPSTQQARHAFLKVVSFVSCFTIASGLKYITALSVSTSLYPLSLLFIDELTSLILKKQKKRKINVKQVNVKPIKVN